MADNQSRMVKFSRNASFAAISELTTALLSFAVRVVFVRCLNAEYLGMGGLFTNILTILSLAELGAGTAIVYSMYKPLAENDYEQIKSLISLYKKLYLIIGLLVFVLGLGFIPFLDFFVKERPSIPYQEFILIYVLTVVQTASTYFFSYKFSIFLANQQGYIVQKTNIILSIFKSVLQILILVLLKNYISYLVIGILISFVTNIVLTHRAVTMYPYLREKARPLDKEVSATIKRNILAMLLYKIGIVTATTIDTLIMSRCFGIIMVGIYSNYHLIISYSDKLFSSVLGTITPTLGNLMVTADDEKKMRVFSTMQMIYYWLSTYLAVGLIVCFNPFIEYVFGTEYLFDQSIVIALVISITLTNFQRPCSLTRDATGLFWYGKLRPLAMAILNIIFSIVAIRLWGVIGVVIGTALSKLCTYVWYDPYIVFKHSLKGSLIKYYLKYACHWVLLVALVAVCCMLNNATGFCGLIELIVGAIITTVVVNIVFFIFYFKTRNWEYFLEIVSPVLKKLHLH